MIAGYRVMFKETCSGFSVVPFYSWAGKKALSNRRAGLCHGISVKDNLTGSEVSVSEMHLKFLPLLLQYSAI